MLTSLSLFYSERKEVSEDHTTTETYADHICGMLHCSPLPASLMWILFRRSFLRSLCDAYGSSTLLLPGLRARGFYPQCHVDTALQLRPEKQPTRLVLTDRAAQSTKWYTYIHTMIAQELFYIYSDIFMNVHNLFNNTALKSNMYCTYLITSIIDLYVVSRSDREDVLFYCFVC